MNKLFVSLLVALFALVLPAAASAGGPERPSPCDSGILEYHPHPIDEECILPPDPCVTNWMNDEPADGECFKPEYPCEEPGSSDSHPDKGEFAPEGIELPHPGACAYPDFPDDYCYVNGEPGESGGSEPGHQGSGEKPGRWENGYPAEDIPYPPGYDLDEPGYEDPGEFVCAYDAVPVTQEKGKNRAAARKRALARKKAAAAKRARARKQAARKRAAAKQKRLKAKKATQGRNR